MKRIQNPKLLILKLKYPKTLTPKPKDFDYLAPCTVTSIHTQAPLISALRSRVMWTILMMMRWHANGCVEEDDNDDCGVGDDGGWKWREIETWGLVGVSSLAKREVRKGIKEQEEGKGGVWATWELGQEGHMLSMRTQPLGFLLLDFSFFFFSFSFRVGTRNRLPVVFGSLTQILHFSYFHRLQKSNKIK